MSHRCNIKKRYCFSVAKVQANLVHTNRQLYIMISQPSRWMYVTSVACLAEWLRRWTRNPLGSSRTGSNPVACALLLRVLMRGPLDRRRPPRSPPGACQRQPEVRGRALIAEESTRTPTNTEYQRTSGIRAWGLPHFASLAYRTASTCASRAL